VLNSVPPKCILHRWPSTDTIKRLLNSFLRCPTHPAASGLSRHGDPVAVPCHDIRLFGSWRGSQREYRPNGDAESMVEGQSGKDGGAWRVAVSRPGRPEEPEV
jgi:hypothetical protein